MTIVTSVNAKPFRPSYIATATSLNTQAVGQAFPAWQLPVLACRRSSHVAPKHPAPSSTEAQPPCLDATLATYLLSLVGHVIEGHRLSQAQQVLLASKAVAVYKLVVQVTDYL